MTFIILKWIENMVKILFQPVSLVEMRANFAPGIPAMVSTASLLTGMEADGSVPLFGASSGTHSIRRGRPKLDLATRFFLKRGLLTAT